MRCPRCGKKLNEVTIYNHRVDRCDECGGTWFDKDELKSVKDERDENLSWLDFDLWSDKDKLKSGGTFIDCPRDGSPLFQIQYGPSQVMADVCRECSGVWLDKDELDRIIDSLEEKVNTETLPQYFADLEKEVAHLVSEPRYAKKEIRNIAIIMKLIEYRLAAQYPTILEITSSLPD